MSKSRKPSRRQIGMAMQMAFIELLNWGRVGLSFKMRVTVKYAAFDSIDPDADDGTWLDRYDGDPGNRRRILVSSPQVRSGYYAVGIHGDSDPYAWPGFVRTDR